MDEDEENKIGETCFTYAKVFDNVYFRATLHPPSKQKQKHPQNDKSFHIIIVEEVKERRERDKFEKQ